MKTIKRRQAEKMGLQGGIRAVSQIEGRGKPKIGMAEFMSLAKRFGFSRPALRKIRVAVEAEDLGVGPFLANYYANIPQTKVAAY